MIEIRDDFFDSEMLSRLQRYCSELISGFKHADDQNPHMFFTNMQWATGLVDGDPPSMVLCNMLKWTPHLGGEELHEDVCFYIEQAYPEYVVVEPPMIHLWTHQAKINWHADLIDGVRDGAVTVYLNHRWTFDKGGDFLYNIQPSKKVERVFPEPNRAIFLEGKVWHSTTPVAKENIRKSLQVWLKKRS